VAAAQAVGCPRVVAPAAAWAVVKAVLVAALAVDLVVTVAPVVA